MSLIGDFFNHEKEVERRFRQLDNLNSVIASRITECQELGVELQDLQAKIDSIISKYPNINIDAALEQYHLDLLEENKHLESENATLVASITANNKKLEELQEKLEVAYGLEGIALEKQSLEEARKNLEQYKKVVKTSDCIIATYMVNNIPVTNAFVYLCNTTYREKKSGNIYPAKYYQSLDKVRIIGIANDFSCSIDLMKDTYNGYAVNTKPLYYATFADAYYLLTGESFGRDKITKRELIDFLNEFIKETDISIHDNKVIITHKEKGKSR